MSLLAQLTLPGVSNEDVQCSNPLFLNYQIIKKHFKLEF